MKNNIQKQINNRRMLTIREQIRTKDRINEIIEGCVADDIKDKYRFVLTSRGYAAVLYSNSLVSINISLKTVNRITFRNNEELADKFPSGFNVCVKRDKMDNIPLYVIDIPGKDEKRLIETLNDLKGVISLQQEYIFDKHPADYPFERCSHYEECLKAGECIVYENNRPFFKGCAFRTALKQKQVSEK